LLKPVVFLSVVFETGLLIALRAFEFVVLDLNLLRRGRRLDLIQIY